MGRVGLGEELTRLPQIGHIIGLIARYVGRNSSACGLVWQASAIETGRAKRYCALP